MESILDIISEKKASLQKAVNGGGVYGEKSPGHVLHYAAGTQQ